MNNPNVSYSYTQFSLTFESVLSIHAPFTQRRVRGTQMPFMTESLRQAIMHRSKLLNIFTESKKRSDWEDFRKQRNYCVTPQNQAHKAYFNKLQSTDMDKKKFCKKIGPFFSQKSNKRAKKITYKEENEIMSDERKVAEIFMNYLTNVTETIDLPKYDPPDKAYVDINDPILRAIEKYGSHPSIHRIKLLSKNRPEFKFEHFPWEVKNAINSLKNRTFTAEIPVQVLKRYGDICLFPLD